MKKTWKKLIFTALFSALLLENPALPLKEAVSLTAEAATPALSLSAFRLTRGKMRILRLKNASGTVRWTSSNKAVATVTSKGVVKGIKAGSAFIKAYYKGKTYKCVVVVEAPKLSASTLTLETGTYSQLTLKNTKQSIVWKSSNSSVASVSSSGYVAARKAGTAKISAISGGVTYTCTITVKKASYTPSQTVVKINYQKVVNYIKTNGATNADGDPSIQLKDSKEQNIYSIVYDRSKKQLRFITVFSDDGALATLDMYVNTPKSSRISAEFNMIYEESSTTPIAAQARASFLASSVTRNGTISFTVTERANIDRADAVSIAQDAVRTGFTGWNLLLHKRLGLSLKYLGFTSWK